MLESYAHTYLDVCKSTFRNFSDIASAMDFYKEMNVISILIYMYRFFVIIKFQPRLGLVTSTLAAAVMDLAHWLFLASQIMVFVVNASV